MPIFKSKVKGLTHTAGQKKYDFPMKNVKFKNSGIKTL